MNSKKFKAFRTETDAQRCARFIKMKEEEKENQ
jgi:hypothetical protein